jgi:hypothetical protein
MYVYIFLLLLTAVKESPSMSQRHLDQYMDKHSEYECTI